MSAPKFLKKEEINDKIVIETTGKKIGKGKEIAFALDGSAALFVTTDSGIDMQVPMARIMGVGEYIVVRPAEQVQRPAQAQAQRPAPRPAMAAAAPQARPAVQAPIPPPPMAAAAQAPAAMACRNCGAPLKPGAKFCTKCGTSTV
ncbi:MAG: zinc ribbon domain-containing protein [Thaumarchaeota archaeon]|nr:zinc ribbon domain-containing protein [Nitrososphaerota archaeon]